MANISMTTAMPRTHSMGNTSNPMPF